MENIDNHIEAIFFDLDGTLMDTDNQSVAKFRKWFEWMHLPHSQRLARRLVMASESPFNGLITFMDRIGIDEPVMNFIQRLNWRKGKIKHAFQIIPGIVEMLNELKVSYRLAVVTTRSQAEAEIFIEESHLKGFFELVVNRTSTRRLKPDPEPILFAAKQLNVPVIQCLMVGDTDLDFRSARSAGASFIGVLCGYGTREEFEKAGATAVIEHTKELTWILKQSGLHLK